MLLVEHDDHALGYVSAVRRLHLWSGSDIVALDDLYVRPGFRNQGLGSLLLTELSRRSGAQTITWGVQPDNAAAIRFYERIGATVYPKVMCSWPLERRRSAQVGVSIG